MWCQFLLLCVLCLLLCLLLLLLLLMLMPRMASGYVLRRNQRLCQFAMLLAVNRVCRTLTCSTDLWCAWNTGRWHSCTC